MTLYYGEFIDECGHDAIMHVESSSKAKATEYFEEEYPDMRLQRVQSAEEARQEEADRYRRFEREYDYD